MDTEALRQRFPNGHGRFTQYSLTGLTDPAMTARIPNQIQRYFVEETRLGIPAALQTENLCGWPGAGGTLFPAQINLASTWQPELTQEMSRVIGQESRAVGANSAMSPVIDVSRDPRWGRTYETYGEDPYLVSRMGVAYVKGMQADKTDGVACIAKHFLGYAETQGGLNCAAARIGDRELYETFATPFEAADKEAQVSAMMANYGEIDGIPVGANPRIARTLLRDTMGFDGVLTSDGAAIMKMWNFYHIADTYQQAGELALKGGLGTEIPVGASFAQLPQAVRAGRVDEALLDEAVRPVGYTETHNQGGNRSEKAIRSHNPAILVVCHRQHRQQPDLHVHHHVHDVLLHQRDGPGSGGGWYHLHGGSSGRRFYRPDHGHDH